MAFINSFDEETMTVFIAAGVIAVTVSAPIALDRAYGLERLLIGRGKDGR